MLLGVCCGLAMAGLVLGALSGSVLVYCALGAAGLLIAAGAAVQKAAAARRAEHNHLAAYPPYGY